MERHIADENEVLERVLSNTKANGDCLEYQGYRNSCGYGTVKIGGRNGKFVRVHRFIYSKIKGGIPTGMQVCHTCDNPACCNPEHLFLGNHVVNMKDMANKGRAFRSIGELSGNCKFSKNTVEKVRNDPRPYSVIVQEYKMAKSTVSGIKNYKTRTLG